MGNKFNLEQLKKPAASVSGNALEEKFKRTADIFARVESQVEELETDRLLEFNGHPFKVTENEQFHELVESVRAEGVLSPLIVRVHPREKGYYEILAGHRRQRAAVRAELATVPCIIQNVDDDTAKLIVVSSNKQRSFADMLPSEIAWSLKMEYDALKSQGKRTDLQGELEQYLRSNSELENTGSTLCPLGTKLNNGQQIAETNKLSRRDVYRYIRLTKLNGDLLDLVDEKAVPVRAGVELSYLNREEQQVLSDILGTSDYKVDLKKAEKFKEYSQAGKINEDSARLILSGAVFDVPAKKPTAVKLPYKKLRQYVPEHMAQQELETYILKALEFYSKHKEGAEHGEKKGDATAEAGA